MRTRLATTLLVALTAVLSPTTAQEPPVVVVTTDAGDVALTDWALAASGLLRMGEGALDHAPTISGFKTLAVVHPLWQFSNVVLAKGAILRDERAERRFLQSSQRPLDIRRTLIIVGDLARPERVARHVRELRGTPDDPVYAFVGVQLRNQTRTGVDSGPQPSPFDPAGPIPMTRFEGRFYVFRVNAPQ